MSSQPTVTIVIPYFNTPESVQKLIGMLGQSFPLIVIDNGSDLQLNVPKWVTYVRNTMNTGFSHAANQGASLAKTPYILFLNPDIEIHPEDIRQLVVTAERNSWAAVSPRLVDETGQPQWQYHQPRMGIWQLLQAYTPLKRLKVAQHDSAQQSVLPGACLLVSRKLYDVLGGWDERFWLWWEDVDFSERIFQQGSNSGVDANISVLHTGGESFKPLSDDWKRQVFFHSARVYAGKHWSVVNRYLVQLITFRFSKNILYPVDPKITTSVVVPNMIPELLERFLDENLHTIDLTKNELIIVSSAGTEHILRWRKLHPEIIWIGLPINLGFAHTVNTGFRRARGAQLITVNDDVKLNDGWIDGLLQKVKTRSGSVSPRVVSPDGVLESLGIQVLPSGKVVSNDTDTSNKNMNSFNAAAVLLTRSAVSMVGLFDERFGSYLEDVDLGLRMNQHGWKHELCSSVTVVHQKHQTSRRYPVRKAWQDVRNWWLVVLKNTSFTQWFLSGVPIMIERARNFSGFVKVLVHHSKKKKTIA